MAESRQLQDGRGRKPIAAQLKLCGWEDSEIQALLHRVAEPRAAFVVDDILPEDYVADPPALGFCLEYLLRHLPPAQVSSILRSDDVNRMARRLLFVYRLCNPRIPSYTHEELASLLLDAEQHLQKNRRFLLATGYPATRFTKSVWLDELITDLYRTKLPLRVRTTQAKPGIVEFNYVWSDRSLGFPLGAEQNLGVPFFLDEGHASVPPDQGITESVSTALIHEVSYEQAPPMRGLPLEKAYLLERGRPYIFAVKMDVLRALRDSLSSGKADGLWDACCDAMRKHISGNEAGLFFAMDRPDFSTTTGKASTSRPGLVCGGLSTLMHVVGHCEQELKVGVMHRTRMAMGSLFGMDGEGNKGMHASGSWLSEKESLVVDEAIRQFRDLQSASDRFASEFSQRVVKDLNVQLREAVVVEARVKRDDKRRVHAAASTYLKHLEVVTEAGLPSGPTMESFAENQFVFRREGEQWRISFEGKATWVAHSVGMAYLKVLLGLPNKRLTCWELHDAVFPSGEDGSAFARSGLASHDPEEIINRGWSLAGRDHHKKWGISRAEVEAAIEVLKSRPSDGMRPDKAQEIAEQIEQLEAIAKKLRSKKEKNKSFDTTEDKLTDKMSKAIKRSVESIRVAHSDLGRHLAIAITTGRNFIYQPEKITAWVFE